jgi:hypothetical protein
MRDLLFAPLKTDGCCLVVIDELWLLSYDKFISFSLL